MSFFKNREIWRRNEENHVIRYFDCKLAQIMQARGIKPTQLAQFLNVSPSMVTRWHQAKDLPPSDKQAIIALFLGCKNRCDIWPFKSKHIYDKIAKLNRLHKEADDLETQIKDELDENEKVTP